ncbi:MAG: carbohydrate binding domain-containing protein, partial [Oscillospiraceae bacterium]|nr:carbohydrate binding domain-containing protein [Oscillospiraceae bacterium]
MKKTLCNALAIALSLVMVLHILPLQSIAESSEAQKFEYSEITSYPTDGSEYPEVYDTDRLVDEDWEQQEITAEDIVGEIVELREEDVKHFRLVDGSYIAVQFDHAVHYQNEDGEWEDIDNRLEQGETERLQRRGRGNRGRDRDHSTTRSWSRRGGRNNIDLPQQGRDNEPLISFERDGHSVSISLPGANPVQAVIITPEQPYDDCLGEAVTPQNIMSILRYENILDGVDIEYVFFGEDVKENIIVHNPRDDYSFVFELDLGNLAPVEVEDGSIYLVNPVNGEAIYQIPAPFMFDSDGAFSTDAWYTLAYIGTDDNVSLFNFTVTADEAWMNDEERVWPIIIDPPLITVRDDVFTARYIDSDWPSNQWNTNSLIVGGNAVRRMRTYMHIRELPALPANSMVVSSQIALRQFSNAPGFGPGYRHTNMPAINIGVYPITHSSSQWHFNLTNPSPNVLLDYVRVQAHLEMTWAFWDITRTVKGWYAAPTNTNRNLMFKALEEGTMTGTRNANALFANAHASHMHSFPRLIVQYQNTVGLEDHFTYHIQDIGRAGTGHVADYTGALTIVKPLVSNASTVVPFELSLIYNSQYHDRYYSAVNSRSYAGMHMGHGWKLSTQKSIHEVTLYDSFDGSTLYMRYTDADGTMHYFAPVENHWEDESGLGLRIERINVGIHRYRLTDQQNNRMEFDAAGRLRLITDRNGNRTQFNFGNADFPGRITSISTQLNGHNSVGVAWFIYDQWGFLNRVVDRAGNETRFAYSASRLIRITHADGAFMSYAYGGPGGRLTTATDGESGRLVRYSWNANGTVHEFVNYGRGSGGAARERLVRIERPVMGKTIYRYAGASGDINANDAIYQFMLFDNAGRTVNSYFTDHTRTNILSASAAGFTPPSGTSRQNNRITRSAAMGVASSNMFRNSGMEEGTTHWRFSRTNGFSAATNNPRTGHRSMEWTTRSDAVQQYQTLTLERGQPYTVSAYINTSQVTSFNGGIRLQFRFGSNQVVESPAFDTITSTVVEGGWQRISFTFTPNPATATAVYQVGLIYHPFVGRIHVDDFQLEAAEAPANYNIAVAGNMDWRMAGTHGWQQRAGGHGGFTANQRRTGTHSYFLDGNPLSSNYAFYDVPINATGQTFMLSGWARATSVPLRTDLTEQPGRTFGLQARIVYDNGVEEHHIASFNPDVTDWQYLSLPIVPRQMDREVRTIRIRLLYDFNGNTAYFDNISLVRELSQTFEYDANGNLIRINSSESDANIFTYDGANLRSLVNEHGTFEFTHDDRNNLVTARNANLTMTLAHSSAGNQTSSVLRHSNGTGLSITNSATYTADGNRVDSVTDETGARTIFNYGSVNSIYEMTGQPQSETAPNGTVTVTRLNAQTGRMRDSFIADVVGLRPVYQHGQMVQMERRGFRNGNLLFQSYFFDYDIFGNKTQISVGPTRENARIIVQYEHLPHNGELRRMTFGNGHFIDYTYDFLDRVRTRTYSNGRRIDYTYTGDGQLHRVADTHGHTFEFQYDSIGRPINTTVRESQTNRILSTANQQFDTRGRVSRVSYAVAGFAERFITYAYDNVTGNLSSMRTASGEVLTYHYDGLQRLIRRDGRHSRHYTYRNVSNEQTTIEVASLMYRRGTDHNWIGFYYGYDNMGNIVSVNSHSGRPLDRYVYDAQNQLIRHYDDEEGNSWHFTYDTFGNILTMNTQSQGGFTWRNRTFAYNDPRWPDLLTAINGVQINHDAIGNPLNWRDNMQLTWERGRQLQRIDTPRETLFFLYDSNGLRSIKSTSAANYHYYYIDDL